MGLAIILSLCSEEDAFIASSFINLFPTNAFLGFLIYGPMIDLKSTMMMLSVFKSNFILIFVSLEPIIVHFYRFFFICVNVRCFYSSKKRNNARIN
ncbi:permease [Radiobacillus sp. PE A8.2]|uniref:permease n=1 Tax=Radiobacillus sp. PE A8.2 TaxID=3380349 RepID=UPI00388EE7F3